MVYIVHTHTMGHAIHHSIEIKKGCHIKFNSIVIQSNLLLNQNDHEQTNETIMTTHPTDLATNHHLETRVATEARV